MTLAAGGEPGAAGLNTRTTPVQRTLAAVRARAFARDPMVTWPMVTDQDLVARIRAMFEAVDTPYAAEGWMFDAADGLGVMTLLPPGSSAREEELAAATAPAPSASATRSR